LTNDEVFDLVKQKLNFTLTRAQLDYLQGVIREPSTVYTRARVSRRLAIVRAYYDTINEIVEGKRGTPDRRS